MRILIATLSAAALLTAGAAFAQTDHAAHHATKTSEVTHEMCKQMMGAKMAGAPRHDHGKDKTGAATPGAVKPPTAVEMEAMHAQCKEKMAKAEAEQAPARPN